MLGPWGAGDRMIGTQGLPVHPCLGRSPHACWVPREGLTEGLAAHFRPCDGSHVHPRPLAGLDVAPPSDLRQAPELQGTLLPSL